MNVVKRSAYANELIMQEIDEYHGQNCYIPTSGMCFIKCVIYFTGKDYTEEFLNYIRTVQSRSNVMISSRI